MTVALWVVQILLAVMFLAAGAMKLAQPIAKLAGSMAWVEDFPPAAVRLIGGAEVLAAIGLVVPAALDVVPASTSAAAIGLVALMLGAAIVHARRKETSMIVVNLVLAALAAFVAWGHLTS